MSGEGSFCLCFACMHLLGSSLPLTHQFPQIGSLCQLPLMQLWTLLLPFDSYLFSWFWLNIPRSWACPSWWAWVSHPHSSSHTTAAPVSRALWLTQARDTFCVSPSTHRGPSENPDSTWEWELLQNMCHSPAIFPLPYYLFHCRHAALWYLLDWVWPKF